MQLEIVVAALFLIIANCLVAFKAFRDESFFRKCALHVDGVLISKQYARIVSAGFVHQSWQHLFFHMFMLSCFAWAFRAEMLLHSFLMAYMGGLLGGNLLALHIHRNDGYFQSNGTAGAISGLITACLLLFPDKQIQLFFLPIHLPAWVYGIAAISYSIYGLDNGAFRYKIEEHIGGMIASGCLLHLLHSHLLQEQPLISVGFMMAAATFLILIRERNYDQALPVPVEEPVIIHLYNSAHEYSHTLDKESELNHLLDEVKRIGFQGLNPVQQERLKELSQDPDL